MAILKTQTLPNGSTANYHTVKSAQYGQTEGVLSISVLSFADETSFMAGAGPMWNTPSSMPLDLVANPFLASVEAWLTTSAESVFSGGSVIPGANGTLAIAKIRRWAFIKQSRDTAITKPLATPYGVSDGDESAALSITKAVVLLQALAAAGSPSTIDYTLANNTVVTLDVGKMVNIGLLLGAREQQVRATATALREQIMAATTIDQVTLIHW